MIRPEGVIDVVGVDADIRRKIAEVGKGTGGTERSGCCIAAGGTDQSAYIVLVHHAEQDVTITWVVVKANDSAPVDNVAAVPGAGALAGIFGQCPYFIAEVIREDVFPVEFAET